jgi:hypothetical protein
MNPNPSCSWGLSPVDPSHPDSPKVSAIELTPQAILFRIPWLLIDTSNHGARDDQTTQSLAFSFELSAGSLCYATVLNLFEFIRSLR